MYLEYFKKEIFPLKDKLFRFARSYIRDNGTAEDIVQEVFIRLWNKKSDFKKIKNIEAWSMTITRNLVYDILKSNRYQWVDTSGLKEDEGFEKHPDIILEEKETAEDIRRLINSFFLNMPPTWP